MIVFYDFAPPSPMFAFKFDSIIFFSINAHEFYTTKIPFFNLPILNCF